MLSRRLRIISAAILVILLTVYLHHFELDEKEELEVPPPLALPFKPTSHIDQKSSVLGLRPESTSSVYNVTPLPTPSPVSIDPIAPEEPSQDQDATTTLDDVLLILKTGASTVWRRVPMHLTTTLSISQIPNFVIYSDLEEQLSSTITTIDVIKNETSIIRKFDHEAYETYLDQQSPSHVNTYREHARLPGDEKGEDHSSWMAGWKLDKYKFIPMLAHAQKNWPDLKWYIYIEDDTFIFLDNVMQWLATISSEEPTYYGAYSGDGNETFAQGGSGIVFSHSMMRSVFGGTNAPTLEKYGNETAVGCCGDISLGKVLRDHGIYVNKGVYGTPSLRPEPPWKTGFDDYIWCAPVHTFHHLHARDLATLSELERNHKKKSARPILFRDVFIELILPHLQQPMLSNWDNFASKYVLTNDSIPVDLRSFNSTAFERANLSPESCQTACLMLPDCMSWRHESAGATCGLEKWVTLGRETDPLPTWATETVITSGWMLERINASLMANHCEFTMYR